MPVLVAEAVKLPAVLFAIRAGEVAQPAPFVVAFACPVPSGKVAPAPFAALVMVKVTVIPSPAPFTLNVPSGWTVMGQAAWIESFNTAGGWQIA